MKIKTSITLPDDLLKSIDQADTNRSAFLEKAARKYLAQSEKERMEAKDAAILEAHGDRLNKEALEFLEFQDW